jgi:hypothetical protein
MGQFLTLIGGVLIMSALVGSIAVYLKDRERRNGKGRSVVLFATGILFAGVLAICLFIYAAAPALCSIYPGVECGWYSGIIGVPGFFTLGTAIFVSFWLWRGRPPSLHPIAVYPPPLQFQSLITGTFRRFMHHTMFAVLTMIVVCFVLSLIEGQLVFSYRFVLILLFTTSILCGPIESWVQRARGGFRLRSRETLFAVIYSVFWVVSVSVLWGNVMSFGVVIIFLSSFVFGIFAAAFVLIPINNIGRRITQSSLPTESVSQASGHSVSLNSATLLRTEVQEISPSNPFLMAYLLFSIVGVSIIFYFFLSSKSWAAVLGGGFFIVVWSATFLLLQLTILAIRTSPRKRFWKIATAVSVVNLFVGVPLILLLLSAIFRFLR